MSGQQDEKEKLICEDLEPGDITIFLANSDLGDGLAFFTLTKIAATVNTLFVTDHAWTGTEFETEEEGTIQVSLRSYDVRVLSRQTFSFLDDQLNVAPPYHDIMPSHNSFKFLTMDLRPAKSLATATSKPPSPTIGRYRSLRTRQNLTFPCVEISCWCIA